MKQSPFIDEGEQISALRDPSGTSKFAWRNSGLDFRRGQVSQNIQFFQEQTGLECGNSPQDFAQFAPRGTCPSALPPLLSLQSDPPPPLQRQAAMAAKKTTLQYIEPIGGRVLVLKDEPKRETKGGIALPDAAEIPTITGRIVTISQQVAHDEDVPLRQYDKILFHPKNAIPVDFEPDNQLFVVPVEDIVAVFRNDKPANEKSP